ncbi:uncharacterized protein LOC121393314 [Xenopus laevis]|uniref:Uncharacterized protein LOC121393314 n=1 Tax=Xenopus laevis TaxID=8355 RepID=A0A8J1KJ97_XENLA|nr:uncharacterized protein LOC121393314 [Xenopus laevis]
MGRKDFRCLDPETDTRRIQSRISLFSSTQDSYNTHCIASKTGSFREGNNRIPCCQGSRTSASIPGISRYLLKGFFGTKTKWELPHNNRFEVCQPVHPKVGFPYGKYQIGYKALRSRRLYGFFRPQGRLSSCASFQGPQKIPTNSSVHGRGASSFSISCTALRNNNSSPSVHQDCNNNGSCIEGRRDYDNSLSGRLACHSYISIPASETFGQSDYLPCTTRLDNKLGEVIVTSIQSNEIPGDGNQFSQDESFFTTRESSQSQAISPTDHCQTAFLSQRIDEGARSYDSDDRCCTMGEISHEAPSGGGSPQMGSPAFFLGEEVFSQQRDETPASMVASGSQSYTGIIFPTDELVSSHNRCFPIRMGGPSEPINSTRCLESNGKDYVIKLQRNESSLQGNLGVRTTSQRETSENHVRQFYHSGIYKQARGNQSSLIEQGDTEDYGVGRDQYTQYYGCAHKGREQHLSRSSKQKCIQTGGMVSESRNILENYETLGTSSYRFNGDQEKSQAENVLFPEQAGSPRFPRRDVNQVEFSPGLHIPTNFHDPQGHSEDQGGTSEDHLDNTFLAKESLVLTVDEDGQEGILGPSSSSETPDSRSNCLPRPPQTSANGLESDRSLLESQDISPEVINILVQSRRDSTNKIYSRIWKVFRAWCSGKKVASDQPSIPNLLKFLQEGFDKGLAVNTIKVQISALSAFWGKSLASIPLIKRFVKAISKIRPKIFQPLPSWDLALVLKNLCVSPYEPLESCSIKCLSFKALFLVAITSAKRIGELQALSSKEPYLVFLQDRVVLKPLPFFRPKVASLSNTNQEIILPYINQETQEKDDQLQFLDVGRSLKIYVNRTKEFRKDENLFISFAGKNKGLKASKPSLARWIKETIQMAYIKEDRLPPFQIAAHSTRKMSTSWAEVAGVSMDNICKAATWSNPNTFVRHYRVDILAAQEASFGSRILQRVI